MVIPSPIRRQALRGAYGPILCAVTAGLTPVSLLQIKLSLNYVGRGRCMQFCLPGPF